VAEALDTEEKAMNLARRLISSILALNLVACFGDVSGGAPKAAPQTRRDGVTVFKGLVLGAGPVADRLPEIWAVDEAAVRRQVQQDPEQVARQIEAGVERARARGWSDAVLQTGLSTAAAVRRGEFQEPTLEARKIWNELIVARIKQQDPTFFGRFEEEIQSGEHVRVEKMLLETRGKLMGALDGLLADVARGSGDGFNGTDWYGIVDNVLTIDSWGFGIAAVVTAIALVWWAFLPEEGETVGATKLGRAELVHLVAERLAAR
jgi:hypothetical protein